ncbi:MAG: YceI family protein [Pseudomonadota bacterium]
MQLSNSADRYGAVSKLFHWLTALLILSAIPLGIIANDMAYAIKNPDIASGPAEIARTAFLFSMHKTIGVTAFFVAIGRIAWALSQPKPGLLNGDKKLESLAAETVHWLLYGSLLTVPLSGWIHHAATTGFAPIWWPFGQSLPFVTKDEALAELFSTVHYLLSWLLIVSLALHIAGALKHHVVEKDATLRRMLPGKVSASPSTRQPKHGGAFLTALFVWASVLGGGGALGMYAHHKDETVFETALPKEETQAVAEATNAGNAWFVTEGTLSIKATQLNNPIEGSFADWTADIVFDEIPDADEVYGKVIVDIAITSLTLGSVTSQALGKDYFNAEAHPTANFSASIIKEGGQYVASGDLTIRGVSIPVSMPFTLSVDGDQAVANGELDVDRRDFGVGPQDEASAGATVSVAFALNAERAKDADDSSSSAQSDIIEAPTWTVETGALGIEIIQLGSKVQGTFENWNADIAFNETPLDDESYGRIRAEIDIASLSVGSVTAQAMGADYLDASGFPNAIFDAQVIKPATGYAAVGSLKIKGVEVPVTLPFDLALEGNSAVASGTLEVDRRDFGIGPTDEASLAAQVKIYFELTAAKNE